MSRQKGEPRRSVSFLSSPRGNCPFASNLSHPPHRPPQLRGALSVLSSGCESLLELQGEQVCLCIEKAPAGRWLSSLPPGRRAPGALRSFRRDWTSPCAWLRVAAETASGKPAGVPRELRCESGQQPRERPSSALCRTPPPRPKPGCRTWGVADAREAPGGEVQFPMTVKVADSRVHAWRTVLAWSANQKVERLGSPRAATPPPARITLGKLPFCLELSSLQRIRGSRAQTFSLGPVTSLRT